MGDTLLNVQVEFLCLLTIVGDAPEKKQNIKRCYPELWLKFCNESVPSRLCNVKAITSLIFLVKVKCDRERNRNKHKMKRAAFSVFFQ